MKFHIHAAYECKAQHSYDKTVIGHQALLYYLNGAIDVRIRLGCIPPVILQRLAGNKSIVFRTLDSKLPVRFDHSRCEGRRTTGGPSEEPSSPLSLFFWQHFDKSHISPEPGTALRLRHFPSSAVDTAMAARTGEEWGT